MTDRDPFSPLDEAAELLATDSVQEHPDAGGDDEIIMPVPDDAQPLRQALEQARGCKPRDVWWYCDVEGYKSFTVVRFEDGDGKTYRPFCWVRSATGEGWKPRSAPRPRPLYNLNKLAAKPDAAV